MEEEIKTSINSDMSREEQIKTLANFLKQLMEKPSGDSPKDAKNKKRPVA